MTVLLKGYQGGQLQHCPREMQKIPRLIQEAELRFWDQRNLGFLKKPGVSDQTLSKSRLLRFARKKPSVFDLPGLLHLYSFRRNLSFFKFDDSLVTFWKELLSFSLYTIQSLLFLGCLMLFFIVIFRTRAGMCYRQTREDLPLTPGRASGNIKTSFGNPVRFA